MVVPVAHIRRTPKVTWILWSIIIHRRHVVSCFKIYPIKYNLSLLILVQITSFFSPASPLLKLGDTFSLSSLEILFSANRFVLLLLDILQAMSFPCFIFKVLVFFNRLLTIVIQFSNFLNFMLSQHCYVGKRPLEEKNSHIMRWVSLSCGIAKCFWQISIGR